MNVFFLFTMLFLHGCGYEVSGLFEKQMLSEGIFQNTDFLEVKLKSDFSSISRNIRNGFEIPATMSIKSIGVEIDGNLGVRGNSSLMECAFPKLKFKPLGTKRPTFLNNVSNLLIASHCDNSQANQKFRNGTEDGVLREWFLYNFLRIAEVPTRLTRLARFTYEDTVTNSVETRWGFFLQDIDDTALAMGGSKVEISEDAFELPGRSKFDEATLMQIKLVQNFFGNTDWELDFIKDTRKPDVIYNVSLVSLPNLQFVPVIYDFDLANLVTTSQVKGMIDSSKAGYFNHMPKQTSKFVSETFLAIHQFGDEIARAVLEKFQGAVTEGLMTTKQLPIEENTRNILEENLSAFKYSVDPKLIDMPVTKQDTDLFYESPQSQYSSCKSIPAGTRIRPIEVSDMLIKVQVLEPRKVDCSTYEGWMHRDVVRADER